VPALSIVIPVYNEIAGLPQFHASLLTALQNIAWNWSIWYVNDGSTDGTGPWVEQTSRGDARIHLIELSRNFGHQAALTAGLEIVPGDAVIVMDGDGQHPPAMIPQMLGLHEQGFDIVLTERKSTAGASMLKGLGARLFYSVLSRTSSISVVPNAADFRLMSRIVVDALNRMPEYHRFLRGMVHWLGFRSTTIEYQAPVRIAGESKYSFRKMLNLANHALFSFSLFPLKLCIACGLLLILLSAAEAMYAAGIYFSPQRSTLVPGWSSLMFFLLGIGGVQLMMLGVIGLYIGYIFEEVKRRPVYVIRRIVGPPSS